MFVARFKCSTAAMWHRRAPGPSRNRGDRGQSLVEFALVIPLFLLLLTAVIEFGLLFNAVLNVNFSSRDAALVAAEAGNALGSDCVTLQKVEDDVSAPSDDALIQQVVIAWTDANGVVKTNGASPAVPYSNVWVRTGSTTCVLQSGNIVIPYTRQTNNYPEASRCNILAGCPAPHNGGLDTISVRIIYQYQYHTGLRAIGGGANGWTLDLSNAMRMEPVL